jgi:hypothetical protein
VDALIEERVENATPLESALVTLSRKAQSNPAGLNPSDLQPLRQLVGDGALEYVLVLCSFHCITRIADLMGAEPDTPAPLRRFEPVRRLAIRAAGLWLRIVGTGGRNYCRSYQQAIEAVRPLFEQAAGQPPGDHLRALSPRPQLVEAVQLILEEQLERSSLPLSTLARVHRTVEDHLYSGNEERGATWNQNDPFEDFVATGTRYPHRTTAAVVDALRETGFDDLGVLDLAVAVADANMWARFHRLMGLPSELYYVRRE